MKRKYMKYGFISFIIILMVAFIISACGLYSYPYIEAPDVKIANSSEPVCIIYNASGNDADVFRGYEIYYKFYKQETAYQDQKNDHNNIFSKKEPDYTALVANGYTRCKNVKNIKKDTTYPMLPVDSADRTSNFIIEVNFNTITAGQSGSYEKELKAEYKNDISDENPWKIIPLYRAIKDQDPESDETTSEIDIYKDFNSQDLQYNEYNDSDMPQQSVSLSMYVISYGIYEQSKKLYSKPVWMGYVDCWK